MSGLHLLHFAFLCGWGALVLAELVVEGLGRATPGQLPVTARTHLWLDVLLEVPILAGVVVTGGLLASRLPLDGWLAAKLVAGLIPVTANLVCVGIVAKRARTTDPRSLERLSNGVAATAIVGVPVGILALFLGARRMGWI